MQVVLGGGVWPIGQLIGFVEAPFDAVVEAMRNWKRELRARWRERAFVDMPVLDQLESLAPLWYRRPRRLTIAKARLDYARSSPRP